MNTRDNFISEELVATDPFEFSRLAKSPNYGFGGLGNGILRPKTRILGQNEKSDTILSSYRDSLTLLSDKDSTAKLAEQIATSIQNRIDKAALKKEEEKSVIEEESKKYPVLIGTMIVGGLIVTGILFYVFRKAKTPKLKTA